MQAFQDVLRTRYDVRSNPRANAAEHACWCQNAASRRIAQGRCPQRLIFHCAFWCNKAPSGKQFGSNLHCLLFCRWEPRIERDKELPKLEGSRTLRTSWKLRKVALHFHRKGYLRPDVDQGLPYRRHVRVISRGQARCKCCQTQLHARMDQLRQMCRERGTTRKTEEVKSARLKWRRGRQHHHTQGGGNKATGAALEAKQHTPKEEGKAPPKEGCAPPPLGWCCFSSHPLWVELSSSPALEWCCLLSARNANSSLTSK